jgi:hypothetical protein
MLQLGKMRGENAVPRLETGRNADEQRASAEALERLYASVFRHFRPRTVLPRVIVHFRKYANANSRIRLEQGTLTVDISDLLADAPQPVHEALACILVAKLLRQIPDGKAVLRYRQYLNRSDVRRNLQLVKQERGRKSFLPPGGTTYDLDAIFQELNEKYFYGLMSRPELGWSLRPSRTTLGHYDPSHHVIVLSRLLDSPEAPPLAVHYVMFHEMLHLRHPTEHRGARRCVHTPDFKAAEREFENFREAKRQLRLFVEKAALG